MVRFECRLRFGPGLRRSMGGDAHATVHGRDARATRVARAVWAGVEVGEAEEEVGGAAGLVVVFVASDRYAAASPVVKRRSAARTSRRSPSARNDARGSGCVPAGCGSRRVRGRTGRNPRNSPQAGLAHWA